MRHLALQIDQAVASIHARLALDLHVRPLLHLVLAQSARLYILLLLLDVIDALSINEVDSAQRHHVSVLRGMAVVAAVGARRFGLHLFALGGGLIALISITARVAAISFHLVGLFSCLHHDLMYNIKFFYR